MLFFSILMGSFGVGVFTSDEEEAEVAELDVEGVDLAKAAAKEEIAQ
jgi:hypothetical protein